MTVLVNHTSRSLDLPLEKKHCIERWFLFSGKSPHRFKDSWFSGGLGKNGKYTGTYYEENICILRDSASEQTSSWSWPKGAGRTRTSATAWRPVEKNRCPRNQHPF